MSRKPILISIMACFLAGLLGAYSIAAEPAAYVASMTYWILVLFILCPATVLLILCAIVATIVKKMNYAIAFCVSCILLPLFFFGGLQSMRVLGLARYETSGWNDMRSIDDEPNGSLIVVYTKESTFEEQQRLFNEVISPWKEGPGFTGETGVQASVGL